VTERARIRRGTPPRHARQVAAARRGTAKRKVQAGRALATIPLPMAQIKDIGRKVGVTALGVAIVLGLWFVHIPQFIGTQLGEMAGAAGFSVKRVEIQGIHQMDRLPVYTVALDQKSTAMPLVDLEEVRQKLLQFGWVSDARVSRRLPDTLLVDIVERVPAAIWQYQGKLNLVDKDGRVLSAVDPRAMPDLQVLVGANANAHAVELTEIEAAAPRLKPMMAGANWVGDRRWDIRFQSGETLALPEGDDEAKAALRVFDQSDQNKPLLGQGFPRFDMRLFDSKQPSSHGLVVRLSKEPGYQAGDTPAAPVARLPRAVPAGTNAI
jgi:cell division protein FtsQ